MVHVVASIHVKESSVAEFIKVFKANVPKVEAEEGCIEYIPTVDFQSGLGNQSLNGNLVTIIEKWENMDCLNAHLQAAHMVSYGEAVKDMVEKVELKILENA